MPLTGPKALLAALSKLENLRDPSAPEGKRQFQRFVVRGDAELVSVDHTNTKPVVVPVQIRDIGLGGIGFVSQIPLDVGSVWRVNFLQHGHVIGTQPILVRHSRPVRDALYLIGGQFVVETGLLCLLGVDPSAIRGGARADDNSNFVPPSEVA